jgi:hypothetical protein
MFFVYFRPLFKDFQATKEASGPLPYTQKRTSSEQTLDLDRYPAKMLDPDSGIQ